MKGDNQALREITRPTGALLALLRLVFWTVWAGTVAVPLIGVIDVSIGYSLFDQRLFGVIGLFTYAGLAYFGLCLASACMVKLYPRLARLGMKTVGVALVVQLFTPICK